MAHVSILDLCTRDHVMPSDVTFIARRKAVCAWHVEMTSSFYAVAI